MPPPPAFIFWQKEKVKERRKERRASHQSQTGPLLVFFYFFIFIIICLYLIPTSIDDLRPAFHLERRLFFPFFLLSSFSTPTPQQLFFFLSFTHSTSTLIHHLRSGRQQCTRSRLSLSLSLFSLLPPPAVYTHTHDDDDDDAYWCLSFLHRSSFSSPTSHYHHLLIFPFVQL